MDALVRYLDDPCYLVWGGIKFMEKNGIDVALRAGELHQFLTSTSTSPLPNPGGLTVEAERALVLGLRARAREELGLPPLTHDECLAWKYSPPEPLRSTGVRHLGIREAHPTDAQV